MGDYKIPLNQGRDNLPEKSVRELSDNNNLREENNGLFNQKTFEAITKYNGTPAEKIIQGLTNQYIILGQDRIRGIDTGYGGQGATQASCIDIVAGFGGVLGRGETDEGVPLYTDKSPEVDSARIYISQKANIDDYFYLPDGENGRSYGKSAIAIKADDVRVISRSGIKLVTGTDTHDMGPGIPNDSKYGIDLIGGSGDAELEPIVKANKLKSSLENLSELIIDLAGIIWLMTLSMQATNNILGNHVHPPPTPQTPFVPPSPTTDLAASLVNQSLDGVAEDITTYMKNILAWEFNSLDELGEDYFGSPDNYTS